MFRLKEDQEPAKFLARAGFRPLALLIQHESQEVELRPAAARACAAANSGFSFASVSSFSSPLMAPKSLLRLSDSTSTGVSLALSLDGRPLSRPHPPVTRTSRARATLDPFDAETIRDHTRVGIFQPPPLIALETTARPPTYPGPCGRFRPYRRTAPAPLRAADRVRAGSGPTLTVHSHPVWGEGPSVGSRARA